MTPELYPWQHDQATFRVKRIHPGGGEPQYWIYDPDGEVHEWSLLVLRGCKLSTQQTKAYSLVDHLRFLQVHNLREGDVTFKDLQRYMAGITGSMEDGIYGLWWRRPEQRPLGIDAANNVAWVVREYYQALASIGEVDDAQLMSELEGEVTPVRGQEGRWTASNPLSAGTSSHRPRLVPDEALDALLAEGVLLSKRDRMIIVWLRDSGIRVGGLCGLRFCDLHLESRHACGQRVDPHVHIVPRDDNPNEARAKDKRPVQIDPRNGVVVGGTIRMVSPEMISAYNAYWLDEYLSLTPLVNHDQVLVNLSGTSMGAAMKPRRIRDMLRQACGRAGLDGYVVPHAFRHRAAANLYEKSGYNAQEVADEFGWSDPAMVSQRYGRSAHGKSQQHLKAAWREMSQDDPNHHLQPDRGDG